MSNSDGALVAVAWSARALVAAGARIGRPVLACDLFLDDDTRRHAAAAIRAPGDLAAGFDAAGLPGAIAALCAAWAGPVAGLVYGAGFEDRPGLLDKLGVSVLGNPSAQVAAVKDPVGFAAALTRLGIPHPDIALEPPADPGPWLAKATGRSGGFHIAAAAGAAAAPGTYFQRRVAGEPVAALVAADGAAARVLGFSRQWPAGLAAAPFAYGGAVRPAAIGRRVARDLAEAAVAVVRRFALVGLNSVDFLVDGRDWWLLEVNPRPGATLDIFDAPAWPAMAAHLAAVACRLDTIADPPRRARAAAVVYADADLVVPAAVAWPGWVADRPPAGTRIGPGEPLCTVTAAAPSAAAARRRAAERMAKARALR